MTNILDALEQHSFLDYELGLTVNHRHCRWFTSWFGGCAGVKASYRLDRFGFLLMGKLWIMIRVLFFPMFLILRILSALHEIHYRANIGRKLKILHHTLGVVISGHALIGQNLTLAW